MTSMMQDVVRTGTAASARQLGRNDLAGKTGTTNNQFDTWFAGYSPKQVAIAWMGFDQPRSLGSNETGGHAALPIWIRYMTVALKNVPDLPLEIPEGVDSIKINPYSGGRAGEGGVYEYFYHENPPRANVHRDPSDSEEEYLPESETPDSTAPSLIPGMPSTPEAPTDSGAHTPAPPVHEAPVAPPAADPPAKNRPDDDKVGPIPGHAVIEPRQKTTLFA